MNHITPISDSSSVLAVVAVTLLRGKLPGIDEFLLEIIQAEGATILQRSMNLFIPE
jgi:hypothetical protein